MAYRDVLELADDVNNYVILFQEQRIFDLVAPIDVSDHELRVCLTFYLLGSHVFSQQ